MSHGLKLYSNIFNAIYIIHWMYNNYTLIMLSCYQNMHLKEIIFSFLPFSKEDTSHTRVCHKYLRHTCVCHRYLWHTQYAPVEWVCLSRLRHFYFEKDSNDLGILSMLQISAADTSMLQISVAYTSMTHVFSFENGRNERIISFEWFGLSTVQVFFMISWFNNSLRIIQENILAHNHQHNNKHACQFEYILHCTCRLQYHFIDSCGIGVFLNSYQNIPFDFPINCILTWWSLTYDIDLWSIMNSFSFDLHAEIQVYMSVFWASKAKQARRQIDPLMSNLHVL